MYSQVEKPKENKSRAVVITVAQKKSNGRQCWGVVDNRLGAIARGNMQEMVNSSLQGKQGAQLQTIANNHVAQHQHPIQKKENNTGLPDNLKSGIENLSGYSMDNVKVHYNSDKPAQLNAYAQETNINLTSGQEKHLPHGAGHVVQNLNTENKNAVTKLFSNSKSSGSVIQRALSRGTNTGWGFFGWVNNTAEALWNSLVKLYNTDLPAMRDQLTQKAKDYPLHKAPLELKALEIYGIISIDVTVAYNVATARRDTWEQLIEDGSQLLANLQDIIQDDQLSIDALVTLKKESNDTLQEIRAIRPDAHQNKLFPDLMTDMDAYRNFKDKVNNLKAGKFEKAELETVQQLGTDLKNLLDMRRLTLSLIPEANTTEDFNDPIGTLQKNLIGLRGKNGVTDNQLQELFVYYKTEKLGQILESANPANLIDYLTTNGIDKDYLFPLYVAMNRKNKDADIIEMLNSMGEVNKTRVALLASAIQRTKGDEANNILAMIQVPAPIEVIEHMLRQGNSATVYNLLVTRAINPTDIINCLASNTGEHTVPLLAIEPDTAFILRYDMCGFSRADMLGQMQVLNKVPENKLAFVNNVNNGIINNVATAEVHLGLTDNAGTEHWPIKTVASCTTGQETAAVNDALNRIVNGRPAPAYVGHGPNPKWDTEYYNNGTGGDGKLPGVLGVDVYREYTVQKPLGAEAEGKRRILVRNGRYYYTSNHYKTFTRIR